MARYFKQPKVKQSRAIFIEDGLYHVKTSDMHTHHRTFEDACDAYGMVYGQAPICGVLDQPKGQVVPLVIPDPPVQLKLTPRQQFLKAQETYKNSCETYQKARKTMDEFMELRKANLELFGQIVEKLCK